MFDTPEFPRLGAWVSGQRAALKAYYIDLAESKNTRGPTKRQRRRHTTVLNAEKVALLERCGLGHDDGRAMHSRSSSASSSNSAVVVGTTTNRSAPGGRAPAAGVSKSRDQVWHDQFAKFKEFSQEHGHTRVPVLLNTAKYPKLGNWVAKQRKLNNAGTLKASRRQALTEAGFLWRVSGQKKGGH